MNGSVLVSLFVSVCLCLCVDVDVYIRNPCPENNRDLAVVSTLLCGVVVRFRPYPVLWTAQNL